MAMTIEQYTKKFMDVEANYRELENKAKDLAKSLGVPEDAIKISRLKTAGTQNDRTAALIEMGLIYQNEKIASNRKTKKSRSGQPRK